MNPQRKATLLAALAITLATLAPQAQAAPTDSRFDPADYADNGALALTSGDTITFDTTTTPPTYSGTVSGNGEVVTNQSGNVVMALFNFSSVSIDSGVTVTVTGNRGLVIGSKSTMAIASTISVNGNNSTSGDGGDGGAGGDDGVRTVSINCNAQTATRADGGDDGSGAAFDGHGYGGGQAAIGNTRSGAGGGYGGGGASTATGSAGGLIYGDSPLVDLFGGSGGGGGRHSKNTRDSGGGGGGGAIELTASTSITVTGSITANGGIGGIAGNWRPGGGGSGGGILINAPTVTLDNSTVTANGGNTQGSNASGGGGGRIAVYADTLSTAGATITVAAGAGTDGTPGNGTYYTEGFVPSLLVDTPTVASITTTTAELGGTVKSIVPATVGAEWSTSMGFANGTGTSATGTAPGSVPNTFNDASATGLSASTLYYFHAWADEDGLAGGEVYSDESSFLTEAGQVTGATVTGSGPSGSITIDWTDGTAAAGAIVVIAENATLSGDPVDDTTYTGDLDFTGTGDSLAGGKVVYVGADDDGGSGITVTGLMDATYDIAIYSYAAGGGFTNYQQDSPETLVVPGSKVIITDFVPTTATSYDADPSTGSLAITSSPADMTTAPTCIYTFTLTGASLDGTGTGNDSMQWTLTATTGPSGNLTTGGGLLFANSAAQSGRLNPGHYVTFTPGTVTYGLNGEAATANIGSFVAFTGAHVDRFGTTGSFEIGGETITNDSDVTFTTPPIILHGETVSGQFRYGLIDFEVSTTAEPLGIDSPTADASTTTANLGGRVTGNLAASVGAEWSTSMGFADGTGTATTAGTPSGSVPGTFTDAQASGLTAGETYYFHAIADEDGVPGGELYSEEGVFLTEPDQVSLTSLVRGTGTLTINFSEAATADGTVVVVREDFAVSGDPSDDTTYTANTIFAATDDIGGGQVVFAGTGSSVLVTGLNDDKTYQVSLWAYSEDVGNSLTNYQQDAAAIGGVFSDFVEITRFQAETTAGATGEFSTLANNGTVTITGPDITETPEAPYTRVWNVTVTGADLDGSGGANDTISVDIEMKSEIRDPANPGPGLTFLRAAAATDHPVNTAFWTLGPNDAVRINRYEVASFTPLGVTYSLNGGGSQNGTFLGFTSAQVNNLANGNATIGGQVVSADGPVDLSSTLPIVLEAVADGVANTRFRLTNLAFRIDTSAPTLRVEQPVATNVSTDQADLGGTIAAARSTEDVTDFSTEYSTTQGFATGTGTELAAGGGQTLAQGDPFSHTRSGLTAGTLYFFRNSGTNATDGKTWSVNEGAFLTEPVQASGLIVSAGSESLSVSWTPGSGEDGAIVVVSENSPIEFEPTDEELYAADPEYGFGDDVGPTNPEYVVFANSGSSVVVTGLTAGTTYHVKAWSYSQEGGLTNYQQDGGQTGSGVPTASAYIAWIDSFTSLTDPNDKLPGADPDGDGKDNLYEFGTDDDPTDPAASGKVVGKVQDVGGTDRLTLTLPVRAGASFNPHPTVFDWLQATIDGVTYTVEATTDLDFVGAGNTSFLDEESPALDAGLPALSSTDWEYRTFYTDHDPDPAPDRDFMRAKVTESP